jgi:hypothetical protein
MILSLIRNLFLNSPSLKERFQRNCDIPILSHLLSNLPAHFIDVNLLRTCQTIVDETSMLDNKTLLYSLYKYLLFDFGIWNKADYNIRFGALIVLKNFYSIISTFLFFSRTRTVPIDDNQG